MLVRLVVLINFFSVTSVSIAEISWASVEVNVFNNVESFHRPLQDS